MNDKRIRIYLNDHLALIVAEIELIERSWTSNRSTPLGEFLRRLENEVHAQRSVLRDVLHRVGGKEGIESKVKQSAAWIAEKLGRLKLNDSFLKYSDLSRVIELETLAAAAQGRIALWENIESLSSRDARLDGIGFSLFLEQARQHLSDLDTRRRQAAADAFAEKPTSDEKA